MSTLRVTNIQDTAGANSLTTAQIYNGAAKAWVNFNGTGAVAIRASFNVSSITDNGTGDYTVNFTNAMSDSNFCAIFAGSETTNFGTGSRIFTHHRTEGNSSVRTECIGGDGSPFDAIKYSCAIFR
jgi:hypothetical protein